MTSPAGELELPELQARVAELEDTIRAISEGEVEALVVPGPEGPRIYTLETASDVYRVFVEVMQEGAATVLGGRTIGYANGRLAEMLGRPLDELIGRPIASIFHEHDGAVVEGMLDAHSTAHRELRLRNDAGGDIVVSAALSPLPGAPGDAACVVFTDLRDLRSVEQALAESKRLLDDAGSISKTGGWRYDLKTGKGFWTDEVFHLHGLDPSAGVPHPSDAIGYYEEESRLLVETAFRKALAEGVPYDLDLVLVRADGSKIWVRTHGIPELEDGKVVSLTGTLIDITESKLARRALAARALQQQTAAAFSEHALTDKQISELVDEAVELVARTLDVEFAGALESLPGTGDLRVLSGYGFRVKPAGSRLVGGDSQVAHVLHANTPVVVSDLRVESRFRPSPFLARHGVLSGVTVPIYCDAAPFGVLGAHSRSLHDFTEDDVSFVQTMANILSAAITRSRMDAELEQRVVARTIELREANDELKTFAYSVSHDLRAPLRAIDSFSHALVEDTAGTLDDRALDDIARIQNGVERMGFLIDGLLELSHVSRKELNRELIDLTVLSHSIVAGLLEQAPEREIEVLIADGLVAEGDAQLLRAAVQNLLENAFKFTSTHPTARIELGVETVDGERAYYVRDDGAGFDQAYADDLFAPFRRLHTSSQFPGTGIGLATVRRIVRRHSGRVWACGEIDRGATFYFTLGGQDGTSQSDPARRGQ